MPLWFSRTWQTPSVRGDDALVRTEVATDVLIWQRRVQHSFLHHRSPIGCLARLSTGEDHVTTLSADIGLQQPAHNIAAPCHPLQAVASDDWRLVYIVGCQGVKGDAGIGIRLSVTRRSSGVIIHQHGRDLPEVARDTADVVRRDNADKVSVGDDGNPWSSDCMM